MSEKNPMQIARFDSKGCLMEIIDAFAIGKVKVNIAPYNTSSNKQIALNSFFLDFQEWFAISQKIQLGVLLSAAYNEKYQHEVAKQQNQQYFMKDLCVKFGGTPANKLKDKDRRPSGNDEARVFRIFPSLRENSLMFSIAKGDGKRESNGSIKPLFNVHLNKNDQSTIVTQMPVDYDDLRGACQLVDTRIQAFITKQQFDGVFVSQSQNENREGVSNNPRPVQNMNTPRTENVISDEEAFPPEQNTYPNYPQQGYPQQMVQNGYPQQAYNQPQGQSNNNYFNPGQPPYYYNQAQG